MTDPIDSTLRDGPPAAADINGVPAPFADGRAAENVLTDIDPTSPPPMKTMVYSPDVRIYIARGNKQYDVSNDIVAWSIRRIENGVSSLVFRLSNKAIDAGKGKRKLRYYQLFERMDRVVVWLKRIEWVQVFSGYLDSVPYVQLYPGTVNFRASCTLKRLLHTWWDPGLPASQTIFDQPTEAQREMANGETSVDLGLGSLLRRLLVLVGNWEPENIHIQRFPLGFFLFMEEQLRRMNPGDEANVKSFMELLLGEGDTSLGVGRAASMQQGVTMGGYAIGQPERMLEVIRAVDEMGMGPLTTDMAAAQGLGTVAATGKDQRDQEFFRGQQEVGKNWQDAAMKNDAAVHCFMTIAAESNWLMYANAAVPTSFDYPHEGISTDGSSVGLYQQQDFGEWGDVSQRMNVKASTQMFLQHLARLDWRNMDRAAACQSVQRSAFADGSNYRVHETAAIEQVRALRSGTGTGLGAAGQSPSNPIPGANAGATVVGGAPGAVLPGTTGTAVPGIPTVNGTPGLTAAATALGQPAFNTAGALSCARAQIGKPYKWGERGPATFDCSGLMQFCYRAIGLEIGSYTTEQKNRGQPIPWTNLVPGDLIFPGEAGTDHVVMYAGGNRIVHAPTTGDFVKEADIYFDINAASCRRVPGAEYGGVPFAPFDITRAMSQGAVAGSVTGGLGGVTASGQTEQIARNLFTYQFFPGQFSPDLAILFGNEVGQEEKAFINDEPLMQAVISFAQAGMRNFQSAPNGDFIAYYPDYFGLDGKEAVWNLEDIEMKNVQIDLNDDAMATHVYIAGSMSMQASNNGIVGWLNTKGVATVENEWLFQRMIAAAPHIEGELLQTGAQIMSRYGVRPLSQQMTAIMAGPMEFLTAVQTFMRKWAEQYSTQIETTFMPEVFPGMRVNLVGHNLQAYVTEVTHAGDFENGFTTTMTIMAPSNPSLRKLATSIFTPTSQDIAARRDLQTNKTETTF